MKNFSFSLSRMSKLKRLSHLKLIEKSVLEVVALVAEASVVTRGWGKSVITEIDEDTRKIRLRQESAREIWQKRRNQPTLSNNINHAGDNPEGAAGGSGPPPVHAVATWSYSEGKNSFAATAQPFFPPLFIENFSNRRQENGITAGLWDLRIDFHSSPRACLLPETPPPLRPPAGHRVNLQINYIRNSNLGIREWAPSKFSHWKQPLISPRVNYQISLSLDLITGKEQRKKG